MIPALTLARDRLYPRQDDSFFFSNGKPDRRRKKSRISFSLRVCYTDDVKPLSSTIHGRGDPFVSTHWSVVLTASRGEESPREAEAALAELCRTYWAPLYTFVRGRGHGPHDAQDLTQGFFAHLIEHRIYERTDPEKGKFRSFLLAAMKHFLANAHERAQALKRGGAEAPLPLLEPAVRAAESYYQSQHAAADPAAGADRRFERSWAQAVVDAAMERVSRAYAAAGKETLFASLRPFIAGDAATPPGHDRVAAALDMPASTVRSHVSRLRARYREALRAEVRRTVETDAEVKGELSALLRALADG